MTRFVAGPITPEPEPTVITTRQNGLIVQIVASNKKCSQVIAEVINGKLYLPGLDKDSAYSLGFQRATSGGTIQITFIDEK